MNFPLEITFRDLNKSESIEELIREKASKLERVCDRITSCRVVVERPQRHQRSGNPYRVRLSVAVPPGHELVVRREPTDGTIHDALSSTIRDVFDTAQRQLKEFTEKQRAPY